MKPLFDRFILGFPVLFLKQYPYAWIAIVALWPRSPSLASLFLVIVVLGLVCLRWQTAAWISHIRREHAGKDGKFYVDQPPVAWHQAARNITVLLAGSVLGAYILRGQFGLSFWQLLIMLTGFCIFYQDTRFFGAAVTYVVTATGIAIRFVPGHIDYRLFLSFREISRIEKTTYQTDRNWDFFARARDTKEGLLMTPKNPNGFTRRIEKLFIAPQDQERFLAELPHGYR
ncbi:MAG TPA: hypothetical protein VFG81_17565 [Anaerolineales bacterium]|jgi:hypothetical protein|nr:hypothetical protein [Anaerolineales bacterium]